MHPIIGQLSNDANMAGGGRDVQFHSSLFIKIFIAAQNIIFFQSYQSFYELIIIARQQSRIVRLIKNNQNLKSAIAAKFIPSCILKWTSQAQCFRLIPDFHFPTLRC